MGDMSQRRLGEARFGSQVAGRPPTHPFGARKPQGGLRAIGGGFPRRPTYGGARTDAPAGFPGTAGAVDVCRQGWHRFPDPLAREAGQGLSGEERPQRGGIGGRGASGRPRPAPGRHGACTDRRRTAAALRRAALSREPKGSQSRAGKSSGMQQPVVSLTSRSRNAPAGNLRASFARRSPRGAQRGGRSIRRGGFEAHLVVVLRRRVVEGPDESRVPCSEPRSGPDLHAHGRSEGRARAALGAWRVWGIQGTARGILEVPRRRGGDGIRPGCGSWPEAASEARSLAGHGGRPNRFGRTSETMRVRSVGRLFHGQGGAGSRRGRPSPGPSGGHDFARMILSWVSWVGGRPEQPTAFHDDRIQHGHGAAVWPDVDRRVERGACAGREARCRLG